MQILALGLPRAGTGSLKKALEHLGYGPIFHGYELIKPQNRAQGWTWEKLIDRKYGANKRFSPPLLRSDFDEVLGTFAGTVETPPSAFWEELMDAYPEAQVVLLGRDEEEWEQSFIEAIIPMIYGWDRDVLTAAMYLGLIPKSPNWFYKQLFQGLFRSRSAEEMAANARSVYREHYAAVTAKAEKDGRTFLRMDLSEGWEPLCKFLDKDVPDMSFPHENAGSKAELVKMMRRRTLKQLMGKVGAIAGGVGIVTSAVGLAVSNWSLRHSWIAR